MAKLVFVYIDLAGEPTLVGRLWTHDRGRRESATFEYDGSWTVSPVSFALEPALSITESRHHTSNKAQFGAIGDSAPDNWGRILMRRAARISDRQSDRTPRTLREIDYLLMVDDEGRLGALRFALEEGGPFLAKHNGSRIPPLIELARLLAASDSVIRDEETTEELKLLLAPGSSLGGAQPKASVLDNQSQLSIAKFPSRNDDYNRVVWEAVALDLAELSGISVPIRELISIEDRKILLVRRFDRKGTIRLPFISGTSMIGSYEHEVRSYLELADALRTHGARPLADLRELWCRIVFTVLISNVDDHMRNHGFLYTGTTGWILSPAYDLNPTPIDISPRILASAIDVDDQTASLENALNVAEYFGLDANQAWVEVRRIGKVVSNWRLVAEHRELSRQEIERMSSAFEHDDLKQSIAGSG